MRSCACVIPRRELSGKRLIHNHSNGKYDSQYRESTSKVNILVYQPDWPAGNDLCLDKCPANLNVNQSNAVWKKTQARKSGGFSRLQKCSTRNGYHRSRRKSIVTKVLPVYGALSRQRSSDWPGVFIHEIS